MKFVLFRHAHKGITPFEDPELSMQGFMQAQKLYELVQNQKIAAPNKLLVSPRRRASQTFYPLAKQLSLDLIIDAHLDQRLAFESARDFKNRVQIFLNSLPTDSDIFACTHYDWIEEAMALINCDKVLTSFEFSHWSPTQFVEFEIINNQWKFIQKGSVK